MFTYNRWSKDPRKIKWFSTCTTTCQVWSWFVQSYWLQSYWFQKKTKMAAIFDNWSGAKSIDFLHLTQWTRTSSLKMVVIAISKLLLFKCIQDGRHGGHIGFWIGPHTLTQGSCVPIFLLIHQGVLKLLRKQMCDWRKDGKKVTSGVVAAIFILCPADFQILTQDSYVPKVVLIYQGFLKW